jgi:hypothetical protein
MCSRIPRERALRKDPEFRIDGRNVRVFVFCGWDFSLIAYNLPSKLIPTSTFLPLQSMTSTIMVRSSTLLVLVTIHL